MDFFGNCSLDEKDIYLKIGDKSFKVICHGNRYNYTMILSDEFFNPSPKLYDSDRFFLKKVEAYHKGKSSWSATSYLLIEKKTKKIKSVINKRIQIGQKGTGNKVLYTQYEVSGICNSGNKVSVDFLKINDKGGRTSVYQESKLCRFSEFHFLADMSSFIQKGVILDILEKRGPGARAPAQSTDSTSTVFNFPLNLDL